MGTVFQHILQMSIYGSIAIVAVLILRKCFHGLPKRVTCLFWLIPGLRLLCPLNFGTVFSVMNIAKLSENADAKINRAADAMLPALTTAPAATRVIRMEPEPATGTGLLSHLRDPQTVMALVWLAGMIVILTCLTAKTVSMMRILKTAKPAPGGRYYVTDAVETSFVLGVFRPRIYMQSGLSRSEASYILQHERMHIRNLDHLTRIVGVAIVCVYWFDPFVWVGFAKMCADLEMRCDEAVIDRMGERIKKEYCRSMVRHAMDRGRANRGVYAAFAGDNCNGREIRMRIRNLTQYKKISKIAALAVIVFALGLTIVLSTKAQIKNEPENQATETESEEVKAAADEIVTSPEEKKGAPVSTPGNLPLDTTPEENLENYGKDELAIPDDVIYSDEGRPFSKTYDYRDTPVLNRIGTTLEKDGFEIQDPETEYLDQDGNVRTGRELYVVSASKEDAKGVMFVTVSMVSEDYAGESFDDFKEKDGIRYVTSGNGGEDGGWYVIRAYDPKTGVMVDASGNYEFDWEAAGIFD